MNRWKFAHLVFGGKLRDILNVIERANYEPTAVATEIRNLIEWAEKNAK